MVKMDILEYVVREIKKEDIVLCKDLKGNWLHKKWCQLSYYDKDWGCPRFEKCKDEPLLFDIGKEPFIIVGIKCDFFKYIDEMRQFHNELCKKNWSERKLRNSIWWQRHIDKMLRIATERVIEDYDFKGYYNLDYTVRPEINGIFIIATMLRLGYEIELKPINVLWKINLIYNRISDRGQKKIMEYF